MAYYKENTSNKSIEIYLEGKQLREISDSLGRNSWNWSCEKQCWYNYYCKANLDFAKSICYHYNFLLKEAKRKEEAEKKQREREKANNPIILGKKVSFQSRGFGWREGCYY